MKEVLYSKKRSKPFGSFAQATVWKGKNEDIIFTAATARNEKGECVGVNDIKKQTEKALDSIKTSLEQVGATLNDVMKVTVYVKDMADLSIIHDVRRRYWEGLTYPASCLVEVSKFVKEEFLIEIDVIAIKETHNDWGIFKKG